MKHAWLDYEHLNALLCGRCGLWAMSVGQREQMDINGCVTREDWENGR